MNASQLLDRTHPAKGSKYSPNLHKWLSAWTRRYSKTAEAIPRVFQDADGGFWIGMLHESDNSLIGCRIMGVLCNGAREATANYIRERNLVELPTFWQDYVRDGRCAIDTDHKNHFIGDTDRWVTTFDVRACRWCGHHVQVKLVWAETVSKSEWVPA